jgi:hypothetical protein
MATVQKQFEFDKPLPRSKPKFHNLVDEGSLRAARREAMSAESLEGKIRIAYDLIAKAGRQGMTLREVAESTNRGINCWTQPFKTLRNEKLIKTIALRRAGGTVHVVTSLE